jgi:hypothetical protein
MLMASSMHCSRESRSLYFKEMHFKVSDTDVLPPPKITVVAASQPMHLKHLY